MRSISLFKIELPDKSSVYIKQKQYRIFLGNDAKRYFTDLKQAKAFLAETNRFLNDRLHELNYMYGVLFGEYRKVWFYMSDNYETKQIEGKIISAFAFIDKSFMNAGTRSGTINGNYFVFNYMYAIIEHLFIIIDEIIKVLKHRRYASEEKRIETFRRQIDFMKCEIDKFGKVDDKENG